MKKNILAILTFVFVFVILLPMSFAAQPSDTDDITGLAPYISGTASLGKVTNDKTFKYEFEIPEDSQSIYNSHIVELKSENDIYNLTSGSRVILANDKKSGSISVSINPKSYKAGDYTLSVKVESKDGASSTFKSTLSILNLSTITLDANGSYFNATNLGTLSQDKKTITITKDYGTVVTLPTPVAKKIKVTINNGTSVEENEYSAAFKSFNKPSYGTLSGLKYTFTGSYGQVSKILASYDAVSVYLPKLENKNGAYFVGYYKTAHDVNDYAEDKSNLLTKGDEYINVSSDIEIYARFQMPNELTLDASMTDDTGASQTNNLEITWNENDLINKTYKVFLSDDGGATYNYVKTNGAYNQKETNTYYHNDLGEIADEMQMYYSYTEIPGCDNADVMHRTCYHSLSIVDITNKLYENDFSVAKTYSHRAYNAKTKSYGTWDITGEFAYAYKNEAGKYVIELEENPNYDCIKLYRKTYVFVFQSTNGGCTNKINDNYARNVMYYYYVPVETQTDANISNEFGIKDTFISGQSDVTPCRNLENKNYYAYFKGRGYLEGEDKNSRNEYPTFDYYVNGLMSPGYRQEWHDVAYHDALTYGFPWSEFTDESSEYKCMGHTEVSDFTTNTVKVKNFSDESAPSAIGQYTLEYSTTSHKINLSFEDATDNGRDIKIYAKSLDENGNLLKQSDYKELSLYSGIDGYLYNINYDPVSPISKNVANIKTSKTQFAIDCQEDGQIIPVRYIHIAAVDKAGNVGPTTDIKLEYSPESTITVITQDSLGNEISNSYTNKILTSVPLANSNIDYLYTINLDTCDLGTVKTGSNILKTYKKLVEYEKVYPFYGELSQYKDYTYSDGKKVTLPSAVIHYGFEGSTQTLKAIYKIDKTTLPGVTPIDEEHYFMGWYTEKYSDTDKEVHEDTFVGQAGDSVELDKNITLYARYSALTLTAEGDNKTSYSKYRKYENKTSYKDLEDFFVGTTKLKWYQNDFENKQYRIDESKDGINWYPAQEYEN